MCRRRQGWRRSSKAPRHRRIGKQRQPTQRYRSWATIVALLWLNLSVIAGWATTAPAQERLGVEPPPRLPGPIEPSFPEEQPPPPLPRPTLPPLPPQPPEERERLPLPRVFIRQIKITGNTVFSEEDLAAVTTAYVNRYVTSEHLEALRLALTRFYVEAGYINSGALLPDQTVTEGVITYHIIEGALTNVTVEGNRWFREGYIRKRLALDVEPPLHIGVLQDRLQRLQQDDRIERLDAELRPGVWLGESVLHVRVEEQLPFFVALEFNNYQSATVGAERGLITVAHRNLTGNGDIWSFTYGRSAGLDLQVDTSYALPLSPRDTTVGLRYQRNNSSVIEASFEPLEIESESEIFTLSLRHPVYRTLRRELALALAVERLQSKTFLLGQPFSFALGTRDGEATDTALRLSAEWHHRAQNQVFAARSRFSVGIDALGATINRSDLPDGQFFAWLGQFQWARRLETQAIELLFRLDLQLTADPLLPLEQIAVGGRYSVRGYRENQLVRDNALIASLESRLPLIRNRRWAEFVQLVPFVDFGEASNRQVPTPDPTTLVSVGLGLRWAATFGTVVPLRAQFELFWGLKLKNVETEGGDLQDQGLHFQFVLSAF
jgi:hemolysin activation/secretion protein